MDIKDLTLEELELAKEGCCEACKGEVYFWDSNCRFNCDVLAAEAAKVVEELAAEEEE